MRWFWIVAPALLAGAAGTTGGPSGTAAGYCLEFDGVDDAVWVARSPALEPDELTVELWARLDGPQDWNTRLLRKGEQDAYFLAADQDLDRHMQFLVTRGHEVQLAAEDVQPHGAYDSTWHHFLGVYALDHVEFWVDGQHVSSVRHGLGALTHQPLTDLYIGAGLPVTLENEYFAGRIDEVRIWDYARSPAEIAASWYTSVVGPAPGLVAYWSFDEGQGQVALDASGLGHDGVLGASRDPEASDPTWVVSDLPLGAGTPAGYGLCFDGADDFARVPQDASLEPKLLTIELWARLDAPQTVNTRLVRKAAHWSPGYFLAADQDGDQRMQLIANFGTHLLAAEDPEPHTAYVGAWHHFAGVYNRRTAEFFVDGVLVRRVVHAPEPLVHRPPVDLYFGAGLPSPDPSEHFEGCLDEVRIWNRPLTAHEIAAGLHQRLTGHEEGLVGYWNFDAGAGQVAADSSPFANHGELGATASADASDPTWAVSAAPLAWWAGP
jgi:hypothetical protein